MKPPRWLSTPCSARSSRDEHERLGRRVREGTDRLEKAVRGLDNTVFRLIADWPKTMYSQSTEHGLPYGGERRASSGGLAVGLARTVVGVYELATFPVPHPADYQPILHPQFAHEPEEPRFAR